MKLKFKKQAYQGKAVDAVVNCFKSQPNIDRLTYRIDPGTKDNGNLSFLELPGFKNAELKIPTHQILQNINEVQKNQNLPLSESLVQSKICPINLDVEMETGTGKTYCYIKTMYELNKNYGWNKFIIVVPSIAIREGVYKTLQITSDHFLEDYKKRIKFFIYNSKQLHELESYSSDSGINVMVINVQAFNAKGKDNRRIYEELDDFQTRRPIDVIKANNPILILDEPQKMEGAKTLDSLIEFNPLMILRYSATHKTEHNKIYRLDALDAYNQKLVKKISVRGITVKGLSGTSAYLYLESIEISTQAPTARLEIEVKQKSGIKRVTRRIKKGDNLFALSEGLDQYKDYLVVDINAMTDTISFKNGVELKAGEAYGDVNELTVRRIQIREAIRSHLEKERSLFHQGIKVLSLFFIDEVAKYRKYNDEGEVQGEYASIFEEEYNQCVSDLGLLVEPDYKIYLEGIQASKTHNGYFSIDKKSNRLVDPSTGRSSETDDVDAYDLILKDKEKLLSFHEPTRFIFSHSALREGWDNPNVFVICALKHSDNTVSRRQEVGRGLRICVNQQGDRQDSPSTVHQVNVLTVVASESYKDFVTGLQTDIKEALSARPRFANEEYFTGKVLVSETGKIEITPQLSKLIYRYLVKNDYTDEDDSISSKYHEAVKNEHLAELPEDLKPYSEQIFQLINSVYSDAYLPLIEDDRGLKENPLNENFNKKEFKELWNRINRKAVYTVHFDSEELIKNCIPVLDSYLKVSPLQYTIQRGEQEDIVTSDQLESGTGFKVKETTVENNNSSIYSAVKYDLIGKIADGTKLTRRTVAIILKGMNKIVFDQFAINPEDFIAKTIQLINEQKATVIIEHLKYDLTTKTHEEKIFTDVPKQDFSNAGEPLKRHIYDYVVTDSKNERNFVTELDTSTEVVLYAKLPRGFSIPTPVGDYNPDWAISFKEGFVKHIYFVAETKGSMSSMELREVEKIRIECARKFFHTLASKVAPPDIKYDVVDNFGKLMEIVNS